MIDIEFLLQLVDSMSDAVVKLETAKEKNRLEDFNQTKKFILEIQKKISEVLTQNVK